MTKPKAEENTISDRIALYRFYIVAALSLIAEGGFVIAMLASLFIPNLPGRMEPTALLFAITGLVNIWVNPPDNKKKEGDSVNTTALPGASVNQTFED